MSDESAENVMKHNKKRSECDDNILELYRIILILNSRRREQKCIDNCANKQRLKSTLASVYFQTL